ncbi:peptidoglycan editing factor PgeF [Aquincola sp. MAHUQ-54]|uniref:Purine nucleoside phosphorylase n=1 Tax=Aquincola agrisoli TaxID=3119538 RepID=A0AAW9QBW8_9BURK
MRPDGLTPGWAAPAGVGAWMSTRDGGVSTGPWASLNLGTAVGDEPAAVQENRRRFARAIGAEPVFLRQVHGARVVRVVAADAARTEPLEADACVTTERGVACTVQVADCLPVLFAAPAGRAVAAAHAGWRGLAGGVLDAALEALCAAAGCAPAEVQAWLGPCIGPRQFEVGAEVVAAFAAHGPDARFVPRARADGSAAWLADLPGLARDRLAGLGVATVSGGTWCTVEDRSRFFSYRRDGVTGRLAAAVWRD